MVEIVLVSWEFPIPIYSEQVLGYTLAIFISSIESSLFRFQAHF